MREESDKWRIANKRINIDMKMERDKENSKNDTLTHKRF